MKTDQLKGVANKPSTIDEYMAAFPDEVKAIIAEVRATVKKAAPMVEEKISYDIPTFMIGKSYLVYFGAFKNHIGFYPAPIENEGFKEILSPYKSGKGSVQFPYNKPMPLDVITKIVKFRLKQHQDNETKK